MLFVNFKTYNQTTGKKAVALAKLCEKTSKKIILVVQALDLKEIAKAVSLPVYCQHIDPDEQGAHTGSVTIEAARQAGAKGTILNHSENRIPLKQIKETIKQCKKKNFPVLVCAQDPREVGKIAKLKPDFVAYEPPSLIGGKISVATAKPDAIAKGLKKAGRIPFIAGAGINTAEDVRISLKLGAKGVLVASCICKARSQKKALLNLLEGFKAQSHRS